MELSEHHQWWKRQGGQELRRLLTDEWNSAGVEGLPADEYDGYRGPIVDRLRRGAPASEIARYLSCAERKRMGLERTSRTEDDLLQLSERLIRWYRESTARWSQNRITPENH